MQNQATTMKAKTVVRQPATTATTPQTESSYHSGTNHLAKDNNSISKRIWYTDQPTKPMTAILYENMH